MRTSSFFIYLILSIGFMLSSCRKHQEIDPAVDERSETQKIKDSIYYYYQQYSLWTDPHIPKLPTLDEFSDQYSGPQQVLSALMSYTPANEQVPIDRYSYLSEINGSVADIPLEDGKNHGSGLYFQLGSINNSEAYPIVYFVEGGSPADQKGIRRSDRLIGINGDLNLSIAVDCHSQGCDILDQQQYDKVLMLLESIDQEDKIELTFLRKEEKITVTLHSTLYSINPISQPIVLKYSNATIGYFSISSFEHLDLQNTVRPSLQTTFQTFESAHIDHLVIDLRYNKGGYVETAQWIANKICPAHADQQLMMRYLTNSYLSMPRSHLPAYVNFDDVYFSRDNQLTLRKVYFLVSKETASAAELLINVLKPYMDVVLIGVENRTYGKPVGYFEQNIMDKVSLWVTSFQMLNAKGESDYWQGMRPDHSYVRDYIFKDFGDPAESMFATAIGDAIGTNPQSQSLRSYMSNGKPYNAVSARQLDRITPLPSRLNR